MASAEYTKCLTCYGSRVMMGGGMIQRDCEACDGTGRIAKPIPDEIEYLLAKESESYKQAVTKIKEVDPTISDDDAEKIFSDEYNKIKPIKKKK